MATVINGISASEQCEHLQTVLYNPFLISLGFGLSLSVWTGRHPPPPPADGYCCGRYASYWNAFLFTLSGCKDQKKCSLSLTVNEPLMIAFAITWRRYRRARRRRTLRSGSAGMRRVAPSRDDPSRRIGPPRPPHSEKGGGKYMYNGFQLFFRKGPFTPSVSYTSAMSLAISLWLVAVFGNYFGSPKSALGNSHYEVRKSQNTFKKAFA